VPHKATFAWVYVRHRFHCGDYLRNRGTELCLVRCAKKSQETDPRSLARRVWGDDANIANHLYWQTEKVTRRRLKKDNERNRGNKLGAEDLRPLWTTGREHAVGPCFGWFSWPFQTLFYMHCRLNIATHHDQNIANGVSSVKLDK